MRKTYAEILKQFVCKWFPLTRVALKLTQAKMAAYLCMDTRSYVEIERRESCCSALTLALFLIYCCTDPEKFLRDLKDAFENAEKAA